MSANVKPVPEGFSGITPYITVHGAAAALDFYRDAFGAVETMRLMQPDGRVGHAEIRIGGAVLMLSDEFPEMQIVGPKALGGTAVGLHLYVPDVDAFVARAAAAGATIERPPADQFYGDRSAWLKDPYGHRWNVATHLEDVSAEEMQSRLDALDGEEHA